MSPRPYTVSFVCTGNICRSPIGEVVLRDLLTQADLPVPVSVISAGTGDWHVGGPADPRALATLTEFGHDGAAHRARQFTRDSFAEADLVLALDRSHEQALRRMAPTPEDAAKVRLLRSFDPDAVAAGELEVDDPYFGEDAGFRRTYEEVLAACHGVVEHLRQVLATMDAAAEH
ncbi:low molecular weight protein-tyrosine-phosphatase [Georgenia faecalis]|uniref:low molecular weight protein-tyrosine-phosphatase n=1 Tax=Georgenia faecalis TaxID=2483799 RepID=UPI000FD78EDA|nr:low molecular weight protein-tyrosine-phosphatase [Georgenia faecalis]